MNAESVTGLAADGDPSTARYCFTVEEGVSLISMQIDFLIVDGGVSWTLRDPSGEVRSLEERRGWNMGSASRRFEAETGTWLLEISVDELNGGYHWSWTAGP